MDSVIYVSEVSVAGPSVTAINLDGTFKKDFSMPNVIDAVSDLIPIEEQEAESSIISRKSKTSMNTNNYMFAIGTAKNGINDLSSIVIKVNIGAKSSLSLDLTPEKWVSNVQFYPVPVQEKMNLSFSNSISPTKIAVYSSNGTELYSSKVQSTSGTEIDMSIFASGVYFIKVFSDSGVTTKKIIKK